MSDLTVKQLAKVVGISVERLLLKFKEAGLLFSDAHQLVSEEQKGILLNYLNDLKKIFYLDSRINIKNSLNLFKSKGIIKNKIENDVCIGGKKISVEIRKKKMYMDNDLFTKTKNCQINLKDFSIVKQYDNKNNLNIDLVNDNNNTIIEKNYDIQNQTKLYEKNILIRKDNRKFIGINNNRKNFLKSNKKMISNINNIYLKKIEDRKFEKNKKKNFNKTILLEKDTKFKIGKMNVKHYMNLDDENDKKIINRLKKINKSKKNCVKNKINAHAENINLLINHGFEKPCKPIEKEIFLPNSISILELAKRMSVKATEIIKVMMNLGSIITINQVIDQNTASIIVESMGHKFILEKENSIEDILKNNVIEKKNINLNDSNFTIIRPPIVTIMGHVDHGKTSLIDYIRKTNVVNFEKGGITQHISAYYINYLNRFITFLDTPGHSAFVSMRERGVQITDIIVLVIAADDGVKPQTIEAIQHAKKSNAPIIVAINKIDKCDNINLNRIMHDLSVYDLLPEEWGGNTMYISISAKFGTGINKLLDAILLQSDLLELKVSTCERAEGVVIESYIDKGKGPISVVLMKTGILYKGDFILAGLRYGKVRALLDNNGIYLNSVNPSIPVSILGIPYVTCSGDKVVVVNDERKVREILLCKKRKYQNVRKFNDRAHFTKDILKNMASFSDVKKRLNIILKSDVYGSIEAVSNIILKLSTDMIKIEIVFSGVGNITESDVHLAIVSNSIIIGFNVKSDNSIKKLLKDNLISLYCFNVIYDVENLVKSLLSKMVIPKSREILMGFATVKEVFNVSKFKVIAGCLVNNGIINKCYPIKILRNNTIVHSGMLDNIKRFKENVVEIREGFECGISFRNYTNILLGDIINSYKVID
ncbi:translation initiation factor IF-2 [Candidatus Legionella polyplacis]|uniref:translation initiation factor IF-2 n=1 Tax=Candidatus Legionella polyplacis TaxID=2005262 RepID=UPI0011AB8DCA|nr:translation initiation factor IF-2 [Candidatus Legionella polyplacis]